MDLDSRSFVGLLARCNRPVIVAMVVLLTGGIAGCIDQNQEVATYRKVLEGHTPVPVRTNYMHGEPLTLEASLILANRGNEQLDIQGETYLQSLIARDRAYAAFLPTITIGPSLSWNSKRSAVVSFGANTGSNGGVLTGGTGTGTTGTASGSTAVGGRNRYVTFDVPVAARANLFNGFRDVSTLRAAYANANQNRQLLLDLQQTVLLETAQTYYNVLLAEQSVQVLKNSAAFQDARVADMRSRLGAGIAQPLDVAQTEAQAAATRSSLVQAQNNVVNARQMLAFLTNAQVAAATLIDRLQVPVRLPPIDRSVRIAEQVRPDIRAAAAAVEVARQNVQAAIGEYFPSVTLDLNYYLHRQSFPTNLEWSGLLSANVPVFSAGEIHADVRNAWSRLRQALYQEWQLIRQVDRDVIVALSAVDSSRRSIIELQTEVAAAQEALRQSIDRYQVAGLATNLDVLTAQNSLLTSQLDLATEQFNHKIFYLNLLRSMGQLPLPSGISSMSSGPVSRPTTEQTAPIAPVAPLRHAAPDQAAPPASAPSMTQPETQPAPPASTQAVPVDDTPT